MFDAMRVACTDSFDEFWNWPAVANKSLPPRPHFPEKPAPDDKMHKEIVAGRMLATREHALIRNRSVFPIERPWRIERMRKSTAGRNVNRIHAGGLHPARYLNGFLQPIAAFPIQRKRAGIVIILRVEFYTEKEIRTDLRADSGDNLKDKSCAVFQRTAIIVVSVVNG